MSKIDLINSLIFNAIKHGADCGGSYDSNEENLIESIKQYLEFENIKGYKIEKCDVKDKDRIWCSIIQIISNQHEDKGE